MARALPNRVDTLIIGNGPSALILSYILHGHIPTYDVDSPHPDSILHGKLTKNTSLVDLDVDHLTEHFLASRYSYSTQALPVNVLLDALIRPYGETEGTASCVRWRYEPSKAISHAVVGNTKHAGGQWVDNPVHASLDIGALSYAGMLSLPGYSFAEHYQKRHGEPLPFYMRPTRREVASYFAAYPEQVGVSDSVYNGIELSGIEREAEGFYVRSHNVHCRHLVLATGIFSTLIPPRPLLQPLKALPTPSTTSNLPLLVIGSGFSAADVIISSNPAQKLLHIFKWDPANRPSPLRACHADSYPEYAGVYKRMKLAALSSSTSRDKRPKPHRSRSTVFDLNRNWDLTYEGLPNTEIINVEMPNDNAAEALLTLRDSTGEICQRRIAALSYVVGRRGSIGYLSNDLEQELLPPLSLADANLISGQTFRDKANDNMEITRDVFIIGSLTGDSLVRFSYGSCAYTAGKIIQRSQENEQKPSDCANCLDGGDTIIISSSSSNKRSSRESPLIPAMNGFVGHGTPARKPSDNELERIDTR